MHTGHEVSLRSFQCQMEVVAHNDKGMKPPSCLGARLEQTALERPLALLRPKKIPLVVPTVDHVVTRPRIFQSQLPRHPAGVPFQATSARLSPQRFRQLHSDCKIRDLTPSLGPIPQSSPNGLPVLSGVKTCPPRLAFPCTAPLFRSLLPTACPFCQESRRVPLDWPDPFSGP